MLKARVLHAVNLQMAHVAIMRHDSKIKRLELRWAGIAERYQGTARPSLFDHLVYLVVGLLEAIPIPSRQRGGILKAAGLKGGHLLNPASDETHHTAVSLGPKRKHP